jgi:putative transposase
VEKTYKLRIYPTAEQTSLIQRTFGCCRFVYNRFLDMRVAAYKEGKPTLGYYACCTLLTELKRGVEWLKEVDAIALQPSLQDLEAAYKNFFRRVKSGEKSKGFPKFKSKKHSHKSYRTKQNIATTEQGVKLPKLGLVKTKEMPLTKGRILNATISQSRERKVFRFLVLHRCRDRAIRAYRCSNRN